MVKSKKKERANGFSIGKWTYYHQNGNIKEEERLTKRERKLAFGKSTTKMENSVKQEIGKTVIKQANGVITTKMEY